VNTIPAEFWIVVTQYDVPPNGFYPEHLPRGPLVHESYCLTHDEAVERGRILAGRYGWSTILRVTWPATEGHA
jgi:hypothetical protein